jgi:hypothetical protein
VTIYRIRVVRVRRMARSWECERSASSTIGTSLRWQAAKGTTASLWAPEPIYRWLQGEIGMWCLYGSHESTSGAARQSRVQ